MTLLLLALSISLDSFGIGVSYGIKKIKVGVVPLLIISSISLATLLFSWTAGQLFLRMIPIKTAKLFSCSLLIGLGCGFFVQALLDSLYPAYEERIIKKIRIKSFRIVINIIREPSTSDMDCSGCINIKEALYIGVALSIDALSIGVAAAVYGVPIIYFLAIAFLLNIFLLKFGEFSGKKFGQLISEKYLKFVSGTIIILMGVLKLV